MIKRITRLLRIITLAGVMLFTAPAISAQDRQEIVRDTVALKVQFRQGDRRIDRYYMDNNRSLAEFHNEMQEYVRNSDIEVESVNIIGGASIEGSAELNRDLSDNRAARMVEILRQYAVVPQSKVYVNSRGINWEDVLDMVHEDSRVPDRNKVVDIILNTPEDMRKSALENLGGGAAYKYMYANIFPYVRTGCMTVAFKLIPKFQRPAEVVHDTVYIAQRDTVVHLHIDGTDRPGFFNQNIMNVNGRVGRRGGRYSGGYVDGIQAPDKTGRLDRVDSLLRTPVMAFRSNLLLPAMNLGVEVPLGNRWSVAADWYYPWVWRNPDHKNCLELLGGTGEVRYWFGGRHRPGQEYTKYRLLGHSLAFLGGAGYYDFQQNWAGYQGEFGMLGIDYLYAMPVGRRTGIHLEFDLALGAITMRDIPYDVFYEGGILIHRDGIIKTSSWVGPIKGGVNLVVPVFKKERVTPHASGAAAPKQKAAKPERAPKQAEAKPALAPQPAQIAPESETREWENAWEAVQSSASRSVNTMTVNGKVVK